MYEFRLPDLGEGIREAEILKWHVMPGETIQEDAALVDVETDKASVTIPSPRGGRVLELAGKVGDTITVGQVIVVIDDGMDKPLPQPDPETPGRRPVPAAPATRRLARELGVDLHAVTGTGPAGRVTPEDVQRHRPGQEPDPAPASAQPRMVSPPAPPDSLPFLSVEPLPDFSLEGPVEKEPLRSIRRKVARKMVTSSVLAAHVAHMDEADVTDLERFRKDYNREHDGNSGPHVTLLSFVVRAVTAALKAAPAFNASVDPVREEIVYKKYYNIGVAVDTGKGLVVPVIRETGCKSLKQIAKDIQEVASRARQDQLAVPDLRGGTFTITNIGPLGGTAIIPIINYPEVAILGMGRIQEKPVVRDGEIVIRKMLPLALSFDHRVADGADAARFVNELARYLSDPKLLLLST